MSKGSTFLNVDNLSGKLVIKAQLGNDLRAIPVYNEDITYDELLLMFQRVFRGRLKGTDEVTLKYKDQEGELITLTDTNDLAYAKQMTRYLKIVVAVNGAEVPPVDTETVLQLKRELCGIRNKVNALLEVLDTARVADTLPTTTHPPAPEETEKKQLPLKPAEEAVSANTSQLALSGVSSLFDPLQGKSGGTEKDDPFSSLSTNLAPSTGGGGGLPVVSQPAKIEQETALSSSSAPAVPVSTSISPSPTPVPSGNVQQPQAPPVGDTSSDAYLLSQNGIGGGASTASTHAMPQSQSHFGSQASVASAASGTYPPAQQYQPTSSGTAPPPPAQQVSQYSSYHSTQPTPYYTSPAQSASSGYTPPTAPSFTGGYVPPPQQQPPPQVYGGTSAPYYPPPAAASAPPPQGYHAQGVGPGGQQYQAPQMARPGVYGQRGYFQPGYK